VTRRVVSVSLPEDVAVRLEAALARRKADGRETERSAFVVEGLRGHLDRDERGDRATRSAVEVVAGADLIVPAGADTLRRHAYRIIVREVVQRSEAGHVHVFGRRYRLDGSPSRRDRSPNLYAILDPTRLLPAPHRDRGNVMTASIGPFPLDLDDDGRYDPRRPFRALSADQTSTGWGTARAAARALGKDGGAVYVWRPVEGRWNRYETVPADD
jgi:hypothetical protein